VGKQIETVTGPIGSEGLGITSMHEHVPLGNASTPEQRDDAFQYCVSELVRARQLGLKTIVEVSPRRDAAGIKEVAEKAEMQIVVCTGFYVDLTDEEKLFSVDDYRRHMMAEIELGISGTGIRPGVIKLGAYNEKITDYERRVFTAGGLVQRDTGLPICTHAVAGCMNQQNILADAGADLSKVYYSHVEAEFGWEGRSLSQQIDYLEDVVKKGSTLSYNNFGNWAHTSQASLSEIIRAIIERGYAEHHVATMDLVFDYKTGHRKILWEDINEDGPLRTYAYLLSHAVPWMSSNGVSDQDIDKMIVSTPARIFGG